MAPSLLVALGLLTTACDQAKPTLRTLPYTPEAAPAVTPTPTPVPDSSLSEEALGCDTAHDRCSWPDEPR